MALELKTLLELNQTQKNVLKKVQLAQIKSGVEEPSSRNQKTLDIPFPLLKEIYDLLRLNECASENELKIIQIEVMGMVLDN